jgi:hypothetical protein
MGKSAVHGAARDAGFADRKFAMVVWFGTRRR